MAKHCLTDASVVLNSIDLSDHLLTIEYELTINKQPAAAMSELEDYSMPSTRSLSDINLTLFQDYASNKTYQTLNGLWTNRTTFTAVVKPTSSSASSTNPSFSVSVFISSFSVVAGSRGDGHMCKLVLTPAGALTITQP